MNLNNPRMGPAERDFWLNLDKYLAELEMKEKEERSDRLRSMDEGIDRRPEHSEPGT